MTRQDRTRLRSHAQFALKQPACLSSERPRSWLKLNVGTAWSALAAASAASYRVVYSMPAKFCSRHGARPASLAPGFRTERSAEN